jgi:hypothetical protein
MVKIWARPTLGLFFGLVNANKDKDKDSGGTGTGGLILGDLAVQLGGLLGGIVGIGERFGVYTGLNGAVALLPFLGFGFIGIPIGVHFNRKFGLGIILPVWIGEWWIGLLVGLGIFGLSLLLSMNSQD